MDAEGIRACIASAESLAKGAYIALIQILCIDAVQLKAGYPCRIVADDLAVFEISLMGIFSEQMRCISITRCIKGEILASHEIIINAAKFQYSRGYPHGDIEAIPSCNFCFICLYILQAYC